MANFCKRLVVVAFLLSTVHHLVTGVAAANITTHPATLEGDVCPTVVEFTCTIEDLAILRWFINDTDVAAYLHNTGDTFPITLLSLPGIEINIISAARDSVNADLFDATSTLTTNTSILRAFNMQDFTCGSFVTRSTPVTVNLDLLGPPPPDSSATCSLVTSASGLNVSLQWSSSFNSQHAVERYRVAVDPDPSSSCSSDQVIPSVDHSCPGLSPERNYSITLSAINCGDQEGESHTFTVIPQLLASNPPYNIEVMSGVDANGRIQLTIEWIMSFPISGSCIFYGVADYTLIFEGSAGEMVEVKVVSSDDSCINGSCSTSFSPSMATQPCRVSIMASNAFGGSNIVSADVYDCSDDDYQEGLLVMGVVVGVLFLAVCTSIGCNIFQVIRACKMSGSSIPADVAHVKTPEDTEGNAVMYDEIGMNHLKTANEIPLTKNSAYRQTGGINLSASIA